MVSVRQANERGCTTVHEPAGTEGGTGGEPGSGDRRAWAGRVGAGRVGSVGSAGVDRGWARGSTGERGRG